jgi:hypothetical protein
MATTVQSTGQQGSESFVATTEAAGAGYTGDSRYIAVDADGNVTELGDSIPAAGAPSTSGGTGGGSRRKVPCPTCKTPLGQDKKMLQNQGGNKSTPVNAILPNSNISIWTEFLGTVSALFGKPKITAQEALEECPVCKNKGEVEDYTDTTRQEQAAKAKVEGMKDEITKLEQKLGPPGGNRYTLVAGDEYLEVGMSMNDPGKTYKVHEGKGFVPYGNQIKKGCVPIHGKSNVVRGTNPLALPGGHYHIKCSNKFSVFAGAQGINIESLGPITLNGGITRINGPSVSIGSSIGQTLVEGGDVAIAGNSIALTPAAGGSGQVAIQGSLGVASNITAAGGAHIDGDLSFTSATSPAKVTEVETASQTDQTTGDARWYPFCAIEGVIDFMRCAEEMVLSPRFKAFTPRGIEDITYRVKNLGKKLIGLELQPTGMVFGVMPGPAALPIFNFTHHHKLEDMSHSHTFMGPNIRVLRGADGAQQVRDYASGKTQPAPFPAQKQDEDSILRKALNLLAILFMTKKVT